MTILDRVKKLCQEKGISQGKMEKLIGISNGASSKWKNSSPSLEILQKLSDYFGVSVDYIMNGNTDDKEYYIDDETARIAHVILENDRVLFDVYKSAEHDRLIAYAEKLRELMEMENGEE